MNGRDAAAGIGLLLQLIEQAARVSAVVRVAQAEGRDVTAQELQQIVSETEQARADLTAAIAEARALGR